MRPQLSATANLLPLVLVFTLMILALSAAQVGASPAPSGLERLSQALLIEAP